MRVVFGILLTVILCLAAYIIYSEGKVAPFISAPGVALVPTDLKLNPPTAGRLIDLGYASFEIPTSVPSHPLQHEGGLSAYFPDQGGRPTLGIFRPSRETGPGAATSLANFAQLTGEPPVTLFQLRKRALTAQPYPAWSAFLRGPRQLKVDAFLFKVKSDETEKADRIQIFEDAKHGITVIFRPNVAHVRLTDKSHQLSHTFVVGPSIDVNEFVSALVRTHRFTAPELTDEEWRQLLQESGIPKEAPKASK